ncbi:iron-containing alcohol dehydrogenase [Streptomyces sp. NPDC090741]|uniref:iron-containing alcohol dehydrogenase n=1 Tax=Streptomyces sp. NPDC090741 TaxID=3365967 RepID=UPI0038307B88
MEFADAKEKFFDVLKRAYTFPALGEKAWMVAIPTTSGTGSEVTPFAVISDPAAARKYPLADCALTPNVAVVDPVLPMGLPAALTADSGFDALMHATEAYVSAYANDYTDGLCLQAVKLVFENLEALRGGRAEQSRGGGGHGFRQRLPGPGPRHGAHPGATPSAWPTAGPTPCCRT